MQMVSVLVTIPRNISMMPLLIILLIRFLLFCYIATIVQRYAARSLPRHAAFGILNVVESVPVDPTAEACEELWRSVFDSLLCNNAFVKARFDLLGRGVTRSSIVDESLNNTAADTQLIESIKQARDSDMNFVVSTTAQLRDIEWCATVCLPDLQGKESRSNDLLSENNEKSGNVSFNSYLSAFAKWRENLFALFCSLHDSGKVTVSHDVSTKNSAKLSLSCSVSDEANSFSRADNSVDVAQSLLDKGDAWTNKDSSSKIFKGASTKGKGVIKKGRRRRCENKEEKSTPLAQVLKIDINDLRCAVSLGRSLLCLHEVLEKVDVSTLKPDDAKFASECLRREQLACLSRAVEIFSCCATTLLQIQSDKLDKLDEEDLDETVLTALGPELCLQSFALVRESSRPLLAVTGILASTAWNYLGKLVGSSYQSQSDPSRHSMLACLERAVLVLGSPKSMIASRPQIKALFAPLTKYKHFLQSNINHSIGVELYESGQFEKAAAYLDEASQIRRKLIDDIRGHGEEYNGNVISKGINPLPSLPEVIPDEVVTNVLEYAVGHCCTLLPRKGVDKTDADDIELSLSLTLEYSALTHHAIQKYHSALAFFQEALILRTMRVGKHSLDVASLHFNMGVVYDDLSQYDSSISRYHESLRIRLDHLEKDVSLHGSALEETVLLTLKCMGNVYKVVDDIDNAICCYMKGLEMLNRKYARYREHVDEWCIMGLRLDLAIPVPSIMFNEMKKRQRQSDMSWRSHFQAINKKALCHYFAEETELSPRSTSTISKIKKELVKMHNSVIALVQQKKHADDENAQKAFANSRSKFGGSSMLLATIPSELQGGGDTFEVALMNSSFGLGKIRLGQTRYEEAADLFEVALRSKWVLDPASSSDSDSEFSFKSRSSRSSRKKQVKSVNEDVPEEGQLYYSLGMANAALDDHDRAVRCFLTALRYLRRSLKMVDSQEVARVLFDCATSYYYICDFDQALSLWGECLRILKTHDEKVSVSSRQGICLYCIVLARCSLEKDDAETFSLLNEAQTLLSDCTDKTILAYMEFLTGHFLQRAAAQIPTRCRSRLPTNMRLVPKGSSLEDGMSWKQMCSSALSLFDQVKNECWFDMDDIDEGGDEVKNLPLSAHLFLKKGQVYEMLGSTDQALNFYMDAVNFYRIACGHENVYAASVLHCMGVLCASSQKSDDHALTYFNEALTIRRNVLGGNDCSVAETLYCSASVLARLNRYESSMERYHEALRIQMSAYGQGSKEVALTLAGMGQCHYSYRAYDLARTCLLGALRVRKHRVSQLLTSDDDDDDDPQSNGDELYEEEVALGALFFGLGNINMQLGDHAQAMQNFIESRDMRWRHVGGGSTDKILDRYLTGSTVDEDELLGLGKFI
jgi:tetratricopeptide (TPR) repeat protein